MTMMRRHADALRRHDAKLTPAARADLALVNAALSGGWRQRLAALRCQNFRRRTKLENLLFGYWFMTG
jgi:hypothetical protein